MQAALEHRPAAADDVQHPPGLSRHHRPTVGVYVVGSGSFPGSESVGWPLVSTPCASVAPFFLTDAMPFLALASVS